MQLLGKVVCGCLLLLLTSQTALAFQPCAPPSTMQATICAERSTKSSYQNIVSLVCYPGAGWTGTQFFRMNDYRIVSYQTETDAYGGSATYMVFELSAALDEGTYICRNAALTSSTSTNNVTLIAYPKIAPNSSLAVPRGQQANLPCLFSSSIGTLSSKLYNGNVQWYHQQTTTLFPPLSYPNFNMTISSVAKANAGVYKCTVTLPMPLGGGIISTYATLDVYIPLEVVSQYQKTRAAVYMPGGDTDNSFMCTVQYGNALDSSIPMVTWYLNGLDVTTIAGSGRFMTATTPSVPVDDLNKTMTSYLTVTSGMGQDSGVYQCQFSWKGFTVNKMFNFTIIGTPFLSTLTGSDGQLYLNVTQQAVHQPWSMAVRFTQTGSKATFITTLTGADSSPSLYMVPSGQVPPYKDFTVAVAIKVGDQMGPYSQESTPIGSSPSPSYCSLLSLIKQQPQMSAVVVALIAVVLLLVCVVFVFTAYTCHQRHKSKPCSVASGGLAPVVRSGSDVPEVSDDCAASEPKVLLLEEYCWQARYLEGGLNEITAKKLTCFKIFHEVDTPWQSQQLHGGSNTDQPDHPNTPPALPDRSSTENIPISPNRCYEQLVFVPAPANDYGDVEHVV